ncbi:FxsA family protein [Salinithrix halophila]|uniref:FxsA family protein n=1 Tax=Salinithrix halophila TaxID=1485204 RepID=A0ABV8JEX4_9BACL
MFRILILLMILVPALEIWGLVSIGKVIGSWSTVLAVITTGIVGGWLARWQGLQTLNLARVQLNNGELPGDAILDGVCILSGGLLLLTPGFFTDAAGLFLLIPYTRGIVKLFLKRWFTKWIGSGKIVWVGRRER